jgi:hypothetical protein
MAEGSPTASPTATSPRSGSVLTAEQLRTELHYDAQTGVFTRIACRPGVTQGRIAGVTNRHGYVVITVLFRQYAAHRLAWLYSFRRWPKSQIDHINGDKTDNRISNLREATPSQNKANTSPQRNGSGVKGVSWSVKDQRWHARIQVDGKRVFLGGFASQQEAADAYAAAARLHQGEFAHVSSSEVNHD